jgi:nicotinate-nucleotide adenylyltransferase
VRFLACPPRGPRIGLLGGSFNPAHSGHLHISREAIRMLGLDELWWMVSPGNPLKPTTGMAPFAARLASAKAQSRGQARIRATGIEARLGTRYTVDTIRALTRALPHRHFIWLMGADNLADFHRWRGWRTVARTLPIAVFARPRYMRQSVIAPAMAWLRPYRHGPETARDWTRWRLPAIVILPIRLDPTSATEIRARDPNWADRLDLAQRLTEGPEV